MNPRRRRSALYLPASNARALAKAATLACDVVILDLEDAVDPEAKADARDAAIEALARDAFGAREVVVRVNAIDTAWGEADLAALRAAPRAPDAVLAPKIADASGVAVYDARIPSHCALWAMIETAASVFAVAPIAAAASTTRLSALVVGSNDLAREPGWRPTPDRVAFAAALSLTVAAAHRHGLVALDAVYNGLADPPGFAAECAQGAVFGFDGKTLIHPSQIDAANAAFGASAQDLADARAVVAAFAAPTNAGAGVLRVGGRMVERLHLAQARTMLAAETPGG